MTTSTRFRPAPSALLLALAAGGATLTACEGAVPRVDGKEIVLPSRAPNKRVQALEAPSTDNADANANAFCAGGGVQTRNEFNDDGSFVSEFTCDAGGGIASFRNEGLIDPATGDGAYDQITVLEDGSESAWHFVVDTLEDGVTQVYDGTSDDGVETSHSVYVYADDARTEVTETWHSAAGDYVIEGAYLADGSWEGTTAFDDPSTAPSPDYVYDEIRSADGTSSQVVHMNGDGFTTDYDYSVNEDGSSRYAFDTDLTDTLVAPDFSGSYRYNADLSGEGSYLERFDDGSRMTVNDVIRADGSLTESWSFDDVSTDADVDQEGSIDFAADGTGEGTVTSHIVAGQSQTCQIHIADGVSTVDHCE